MSSKSQQHLLSICKEYKLVRDLAMCAASRPVLRRGRLCICQVDPVDRFHLGLRMIENITILFNKLSTIHERELSTNTKENVGNKLNIRAGGLEIVCSLCTCGQKLIHESKHVSIIITKSQPILLDQDNNTTYASMRVFKLPPRAGTTPSHGLDRCMN